MSNISSEKKDGILFFGFNRPEKKNAITLDMYRGLTAALKAAEADPDVRVALVHGTAGTFTAGNDLGDFLSAPMDGSSPIPPFVDALMHFTKPLVAAVNGPAVGIGTTMLLHCDLVYCDPTAKFAMPFINLGVVPEAASSYILPRIAGQAKAAELLLLGEAFGPDKAREFGIVNDIVPADKLMETATAVAQKLAQKPPAAMRQTKALLRRWNMEDMERASDGELKVFAQMLPAPEAKEAMTAFFEKRKPDFSKFK